MIEVRLFSTFRKGRDKAIYLDPEGFSDIQHVLKHLEIPEDEVAIFLINGNRGDATDKLCDGDVLQVFPFVEAG